MTNIYTISELKADQIMKISGQVNNATSIHDSADELILLAEKIKAERAVSVMR